VPRKGGEIDLKPCAYTTVEALCALGHLGDGVLFVERTGELPSVARLSERYAEPQRKRVRIGRTSRGVDPKLGELFMRRMKRL
jgi:hypothetical protein